MKYLKTIALAAGLMCAASTSQATITINFSSPGEFLNFNGASGFNFSPGNNIFLTSPGVFGDLGTIGNPVGGNYIIGPITTVGGTSSATVTGTGMLTINDGAGNNLTAS